MSCHFSENTSFCLDMTNPCNISLEGRFIMARLTLLLVVLATIGVGDTERLQVRWNKLSLTYHDDFMLLPMHAGTGLLKYQPLEFSVNNPPRRVTGYVALLDDSKGLHFSLPSVGKRVWHVFTPLSLTSTWSSDVWKLGNKFCKVTVSYIVQFYAMYMHFYFILGRSYVDMHVVRTCTRNIHQKVGKQGMPMCGH